MDLFIFMLTLRYNQEGRIEATENRREWMKYPLVRDCTPMVLMADFTNVSEEGLSKVALRILASLVATK